MSETNPRMIEKKIMLTPAQLKKAADPLAIGMTVREKAIFNECRNLFINNLQDKRNDDLPPYSKDKLLNEYLYYLKNNITTIIKQFEGCHIGTIRRMLEKDSSGVR